jgi:hypothetical protein
MRLKDCGKIEVVFGENGAIMGGSGVRHFEYKLRGIGTAGSIRISGDDVFDDSHEGCVVQGL